MIYLTGNCLTYHWEPFKDVRSSTIQVFHKLLNLISCVAKVCLLIIFYYCWLCSAVCITNINCFTAFAVASVIVL